MNDFLQQEYHDPEYSEQYARTNARDKGAAPHWVRCCWFKGFARCKLAEGHPGVHDYPKQESAP